MNHYRKLILVHKIRSLCAQMINFDASKWFLSFNLISAQWERLLNRFCLNDVELDLWRAPYNGLVGHMYMYYILCNPSCVWLWTVNLVKLFFDLSVQIRPFHYFEFSFIVLFLLWSAIVFKLIWLSASNRPTLIN